jgi:hypothetical protein
MPHLIAEQLRVMTIRCQRLAHDCADKNTSNELEGVSAQLTQKARKLIDTKGTKAR